MSWKRVGLLANAVIALGCGSSSDEPEPPKDVPLDIHPANFLDEDEPLALLSDGDAVELAVALQGGHVIYVAGQVANFRTDQAQITARLFDPATLELRKEDSRTIVMRPVNEAPALKQPDLRSRSQVAHLLVCPNDQARDVDEQLWTLELSFTELSNEALPGGLRTGSTRIDVQPRCLHDDPAVQARCTCECEAGYVLGKCTGG